MKKSFLLLLLTLLPLVASASEDEGEAIFYDQIECSPYNEIQMMETEEDDTPETTLRGDVNEDGKISIGDVALLIEILKGGIDTEPYMSFADVDGDGELTMSDLSSLVEIIQGNGHEKIYIAYFGYASGHINSIDTTQGFIILTGDTLTCSVDTRQTSSTPANQVNARDHWLAIPSNSGYECTSVTDSLNLESIHIYTPIRVVNGYDVYEYNTSDNGGFDGAYLNISNFTIKKIK